MEMLKDAVKDGYHGLVDGYNYSISHFGKIMTVAFFMAVVICLFSGIESYIKFKNTK